MFSKKVPKGILKSPKTPPPQPTPTVSINGTEGHGKPERQVTYQTIKCFTTISVAFLIVTKVFSLILFISAFSIKNSLGDYINMVASGDGDILPAFQAVPALFFLIMNMVLAVIMFKLFEAHKSPTLNWLLFVMIMLSVLLMVISLIMLLVLVIHIYKAHEELHNGITDAMQNYSTNSLLKRQLDRLQIEFQCCGSKKYDEWYSIEWYDSNLMQKGTYDKSQGNTPFSCCSITSSFPCIHHNIENTGKVYLYTPELNLSISTKGCYTMIRKRKQEFGWAIIGNLFLYLMLQGALVMFLRFLQTAHQENSKFEGYKRLYTIWLIGWNTKKKNQELPPELPPIPPELME